MLYPPNKTTDLYFARVCGSKSGSSANSNSVAKDRIHKCSPLTVPDTHLFMIRFLWRSSPTVSFILSIVTRCFFGGVLLKKKGE